MLLPKYPVFPFWLEMMLRTARRTLVPYKPKFGSSPEARNTINPRPVIPGPFWPPGQSPFGDWVYAKNGGLLSYTPRTWGGAASPMRAFGGWALAPAGPPNMTSPTASLRDLHYLFSPPATGFISSGPLV